MATTFISKYEPVYAENPLAGLSANQRKRIMNNLNSNSNSNTSSEFPSIYAENPLAGLSANQRKRIMNNLNSNSNSNSNTKSNKSSNKNQSNQTRKNTRSFRNAVFAVSPFAHPEIKEYVEKQKREYYERKRAELPPYVPSETAVAFKKAVLNRLKQQEKAKKQVSFSPNTKQRKTRKLPKNCRPRY